MQVVIDIDENLYKTIKNSGDIYDEDIEDVTLSIIGATPLPKGHGRLIDADALIYKQTHHGNYYTSFELIDRNDLSNAPTIIEADKKEKK